MEVTPFYAFNRIYSIQLRLSTCLFAGCQPSRGQGQNESVHWPATFYFTMNTLQLPQIVRHNPLASDPMKQTYIQPSLTTASRRFFFCRSLVANVAP